MFVVIPYTIYRWTPPEFSSPEKIWLGGQIAKVGRKAFATSLKKRLSTPDREAKNKPFTFADVLADANTVYTKPYAPPSISAALAGLIFLGFCFWIIATNHRALVTFFSAMLLVGPITIGSLLWMNNKVDRWAQSLIDEYANAVANGWMPQAVARSSESDEVARLNRRREEIGGEIEPRTTAIGEKQSNSEGASDIGLGLDGSDAPMPVFGASVLANFRSKFNGRSIEAEKLARHLFVALSIILAFAALLAWREAVLFSSWLRYIARVEMFSYLLYDKIAIVITSLIVWGSVGLWVRTTRSQFSAIALLLTILFMVVTPEVTMVYKPKFPLDRFIIPGLQLLAAIYLITMTSKLRQLNLREMYGHDRLSEQMARGSV
jgi:hypothetical protein